MFPRSPHGPAGAQLSSSVPGGQRRRRGTSRPRPNRGDGTRRARHLLLAILVLGASALAPALGGEPIDDRFGVESASAPGKPGQGSLVRGDLARAAEHAAWATTGDHHAPSESLRTARRTGPSKLLRFASLGPAPIRAPRTRDLTRLASPEEERVDALIHSLGSAPRGPPVA